MAAKIVTPKLSKGDPSTKDGFKLTILDSSLPVPQNDDTRELIKDLIGSIRRATPQIEIATFELASKKLYPCAGCKTGDGHPPCAVNDIDSPYYQPDDQFIAIYESVIEANAVVFAVTLTPTGFDDRMTRLIQRLHCARHLISENRRVVENAVAIVAIGDTERRGVGKMMCTLTRLGFMFPVPAYVSLNDVKMDVSRSNIEEVAGSAVHMVDLLRR